MLKAIAMSYGSTRMLRLEAKYHPSDDLLREHFERCVLVNVKGAVRPAEYWLWLDPEIDYDLSSFSQRGQRSGDEGPSRLEVELASRVHG